MVFYFTGHMPIGFLNWWGPSPYLLQISLGSSFKGQKVNKVNVDSGLFAVLHEMKRENYKCSLAPIIICRTSSTRRIKHKGEITSPIEHREEEDKEREK